MLELIIGWIFFILTIIFLAYAVVWNIINLFNEIKDYRFLKQNWSPENYFKYYCNKYYGIEVPTEKDIQLLRNVLSELKKQHQNP